MDAEIQAIETDRRDSEGNRLVVRRADIELTLKQYEGLPFGDHKDQHYVEIQASSWEGATQSRLVAQMNAGDLQRLFDFACAEGMVASPLDKRIRELVDELHEALSAHKSSR
jgi:hypothetical protein